MALDCARRLLPVSKGREDYSHITVVVSETINCRVHGFSFNRRSLQFIPSMSR